MGQPFVKLIFTVSGSSFYRNRKVAGAFLSCPDAFLSELRIFYHGGAGALFFYIFVRAAHVNINTVKTKFLAEKRRFIKVVWFGAKNLGDDRAFGFGIGKVNHERVFAWGAKSITGYKLGPHDIWPASPAPLRAGNF